MRVARAQVWVGREGTSFTVVAAMGAWFSRRRATAVARWKRLFSKLRNLRRLQRIFHNAGVYLQQAATRALLSRFSFAMMDNCALDERGGVVAATVEGKALCDTWAALEKAPTQNGQNRVS